MHPDVSALRKPSKRDPVFRTADEKGGPWGVVGGRSPPTLVFTEVRLERTKDALIRLLRYV